MLTKRLSALFTLALMLLLLLSPAAMADDASNVLGGSLIVTAICGGLIFLVGLAIEIYIIYFLYTDANARGQNGVLWAVIGFFLSWVGLIIWLIMRPEKKA